MNRRKSSVASRLLARRAVALKRHIPEAIAGDDHGVHQARVASRRLREAVPVLVADLKGTKSRKTLSKIRQLTKALGTVRELDVTLQLLDELVAAEKLPRPALEAVRGRVVSEREERRSVMLERLEHVNMPKLDRRLAAVDVILSETGSEAWRDALGARLVNRARRSPWRWPLPAICMRPSNCTRCASRPRSPVCARTGQGCRYQVRDRTGSRRQARAGHARPSPRFTGAADPRCGSPGDAW